jgi:hypothetical protein
MNSNFLGTSFVWFHGVVEDIMDPLKLGRVRVRAYGFHTEDKTSNGIPTSGLPWAHVMQPITSAAMSGLGSSPTGILPGSQVIGFFRDPEYWQDMIVLGTLGGKNHFPPNFSTGFSDPSKTYPLADYVNNKEVDTSRLARNEKTEDTIVETKKNSIKRNVPISLGGSWSERKTPYDAKYPYNKVVETVSGHVTEVDDTPGKERLHQYHKAGTFTEIHPDGSQVHKIVGDRVTVVVNNDRVVVSKNRFDTVEADNNSLTIGDLNLEVRGNVNALVEGDIRVQNNGNFYSKTKGKFTCVSEGNMVFVAPRVDINPVGIEASSVSDVVSRRVRTFDADGTETTGNVSVEQKTAADDSSKISSEQIGLIAAGFAGGVLSSNLIPGPPGPPGDQGPPGALSYTVSPVAPAEPRSGDFWLNTATGRFYVSTDDGNSLQWIEFSYAIDPEINTRKSWFLN